MFLKFFLIFFCPPKVEKTTSKSCLPIAEIPSFQKFLFYCTTAQMAEVMVQNVAYRATVYRTGTVRKSYQIIGGFQLEFVSISRVINHMTCYKILLVELVESLFKKKYFTRFSIQSQCKFVALQ
jgi:hypothetical protein